MDLRTKVITRSGGCCEAMVPLPRAWARCGVSPIEDHHALTRARGGDILDALGEIHHHLALCARHHRTAHRALGRLAGLLIDGYVYREGVHVVYSGPDEYLTRTYGRAAEAMFHVKHPTPQEQRTSP